jgi:hypothetical protein
MLTDHPQFFGVLWVFDQLFEAKALDPPTLRVGLEAIAAHQRCRLPRAEIQARLERYAKGKE